MTTSSSQEAREEGARPTLCVIGGGAMGSSIARGLVTAGIIEASGLVICDPDPGKLSDLAAAGARCLASNVEGAQAGCDVTLLAVKPQVLPEVLAELADALAGRLVVSIAAGVNLATLEAGLSASRVIRAMPNLPLQAGSGATALAAGSRATATDVELARSLFSALGCAEAMREDQLDAEGAVVSCGPAYVALFADALTRAGVRSGLPAGMCREMVLVTMRGVCEQLLASGEHPRAYMEKVTSPGGTTAEGLKELEPYLVEGAYAAVEGALRRTRELAG